MKKLTFIFLFISHFSFAQVAEFGKKLDTVIKDKNAKVGFSIVSLDGKFKINRNNEIHYPMQSVYKFHLALAIMNEIDKGNLSLDQKVLIKKSELLPDLYSPLREKYPEGNVNLKLSEILSYTVSQSDNVGCDVLFRLMGGTEKVNQYIQNLGFKDIEIKTTEEEQQKNWNIQFTNWSTPAASAELLVKFYKQQILSKSSTDYLWKLMVETSTGPKKIKGNLPKNTIVGHKTGWSGTNKEGITAAHNDIGIVKMPNGSDFAISVFVSNSKENNETNEKIIADISKIAYDYFEKK